MNSQAALVVSDFRREPFLAALQIAIQTSHLRVFVSAESLLAGDIGDTLSHFSKKILLSILRSLAPVTIVPTKKQAHSHDDCRGCHSSLVSQTFDETACAESYPEKWVKLNRLCEGSQSVAEYVRREGYGKVYVFNGRTASTHHVAQMRRLDGGPQVFVFEYGPKAGTFRVQRGSIHDSHENSLELARFAEERNFCYSKEKATDYVSRKIQNDVEGCYSGRIPSGFNTAIFAGTPYEYMWTVQSGTYFDWDPLILLEEAIKHPLFRRPAALKLHPNSANSKKVGENEERVRNYCSNQGIELFDSSSRVTAVDLIRSSGTVMVGGSSVALDALLLGKIPVFLSSNFFRYLIELLLERFPERPDLGEMAAGLTAEFQGSLVFRQRIDVIVFGKIWALLRKLKGPRPLANRESSWETIR